MNRPFKTFKRKGFLFLIRRHIVFRQEEDDKMERIRIERERELESMRKARAMQLEEEVEDFI